MNGRKRLEIAMNGDRTSSVTRAENARQKSIAPPGDGDVEKPPSPGFENGYGGKFKGCAISLDAITIDIVHRAGDWSALPDVNVLVADVASTLGGHEACEGYVPFAVAVSLADDKTVHDLNLKFRGINKPTNVLSFPVAPGLASMPAAGCGDEPLHIGDVILAVETVAREAGQQGKPLAHHFQHMVIHAILHLIGFRHENEQDAKDMEHVETEVLKSLGIPDPYVST